jgi:hypothetical protein
VLEVFEKVLEVREKVLEVLEKVLEVLEKVLERNRERALDVRNHQKVNRERTSHQ